MTEQVNSTTDAQSETILSATVSPPTGDETTVEVTTGSTWAHVEIDGQAVSHSTDTRNAILQALDIIREETGDALDDRQTVMAELQD